MQQNEFALFSAGLLKNLCTDLHNIFLAFFKKKHIFTQIRTLAVFNNTSSSQCSADTVQVMPSIFVKGLNISIVL